MPTYGYECKSCGHTFDVFQSMSDEPVKLCPQCGREVRRLINGGTGVIFKGSGFYVTDKSRSSTPKQGAKPDSKPGAKTGGPSESPAKTGSGPSGSPASGQTGEPKAGEPKTGEKPKAEPPKTG
ncbi:MAG: zinc ribbon domain-containing protein [Treponema sp.]|jgi:putative FmdB family regulatory protein|nr:zinc ribbon domain-containing protein [Treponema sp.]